MIFSLRFRMMVAVGLLAVAAIVAVALAARQRTRSEFYRFQQLEKTSMSSDADGSRERLLAIIEGRCCDPTILRSAADVLSPQQVLVVADVSGNVIATSGKPLEGLSEIHFSRDGEVVSIDTTRHTHGADVAGVSLRIRVRGTPVGMTNGDAAYLYVFPFPEEEGERPETVFLRSLDRSLLLATTLVATIALLFTWVLTRRIVEPIEELRIATRDLARGHLGRRVETTGSDEIAELARSFNAMAAELENQQALRRNLVHDVVHELRTPLTALRCRVDSISDGLSRNSRKEVVGADEEISHLIRLVEDLHELALAEAHELKFNISEMPLAPIVESAARTAGLDTDPRLRMKLDEGLVVRGDVVRLRQILLNLFSNAARYASGEGAITVRARRCDGETLVEVQNAGNNLPFHDLVHVFDRFYRADPSRQRSTGGTGLGLAIVKSLVEAQGGHVWVRNDASGVTFAFALPD